MARPKVFLTRRIPDAGLNLIREVCDVAIWPDRLPPSPDMVRQQVAGMDGLLTLLTDTIDATVIAAGDRLRVVSQYAVGVNNIDLAACTARKIPVGNTPGILTDTTADIAVTLLLAAARRLGESAADARAGRWQTWEPMGWLGRDLVGRTLGIVGMGRIGFATAKRLHHGWGMNVVYTSRTPKPEADRTLGARRMEFAELLTTSDFVSVHADLNPTTQRLFGANEFATMKPTAVFVNTARGAHVDQVALADALRRGTIFAAGLDVTDPEPLPPNHELFSLPNCVIAPHVASATVDTRDAMARMAAANLLAGLRGERLPDCVNPQVYG